MRRSAKRIMSKPPAKKKHRLPKLLRSPGARVNEKAVDAESLGLEVPENGREPASNDVASGTFNTVNWSETPDRGEDLANMRDPFMQKPELDTEIPPELAQTKASDTPDADENLADRFDKERKSQSPLST